jgi:hypothetical protein
MACVAAAHATWIPKEAEAAPASFSLQLRSRLDGERLRATRTATRNRTPPTGGRQRSELRLRVQLSSHEGAPCRCKDRAQRREGAWDTVEHCAAIR